MRTLLLILLSSVCCITLYGQTYCYKRVMIIDGGNKINVNDDYHYITFNKKGCYESDSQGYAETNGFIRYLKDENNIHCYYGDGYWGKSHYYFSNNYSRLNIKTDDKIYVYQKIVGNKNYAKSRHYQNRNNNGNVLVPYPIPQPHQNGSSNSNRRIICSGCGGSGRCNSCGGTGLMSSESIYTDGHTIISKCPSCKGTGKCGVCHGSGKL